jgi:hypothetical protein
MQPALKDEILRGIKAIADFIGVGERRTFYLAETGGLPLTKEGSTWVGLKTELIAHYRKGAEEAAKRREAHLASSEAKKRSAPGPGRKRRKVVKAFERASTKRAAASSQPRPAPESETGDQMNSV